MMKAEGSVVCEGKQGEFVPVHAIKIREIEVELHSL
jgi:hypothetical protein